MLNRHIPGSVRGVGRSQGYEGLSVLYSEEEVLLGDGRKLRSKTCSVAFEPTPQELKRLNDGASVLLTLLVERVPPMRLSVGEEPMGEDYEARDARGVPLRGDVAFRAGFTMKDMPQFDRASARMEWMGQLALEQSRAMRIAEEALRRPAEGE